MDDNVYLFIYLIGCAFAFIVLMFKIILLLFLRWLTKGNVFNKNIKMLQPPDERSFGAKALFQIGSILVDVALSWISVIINVFHIIVKLFQIVREIFVSTPEEIKSLRFPLINNPNLSREAVWAHMTAVNVKTGADSVNAPALVSQLNELSDYYPSTDKNEALAHLKRLNVIDKSIIEAALDNLSNQDDNYKKYDDSYNSNCDQEESELRVKYPHLVGKIENIYLKVFDAQAERGAPLIKLSFMLYLEETTKIDFSEGSFKWDNLWSLTEELLEHLEKFHEGATIEHEIAVADYWQRAAEAVGELIEENPEIEGAKLEVEPFTNINKIMSFFPKKDNHPDQELSFFDENGSFPRESDGSSYIKKKLEYLGL